MASKGWRDPSTSDSDEFDPPAWGQPGGPSQKQAGFGHRRGEPVQAQLPPRVGDEKYRQGTRKDAAKARRKQEREWERKNAAKVAEEKLELKREVKAKYEGKLATQAMDSEAELTRVKEAYESQLQTEREAADKQLQTGKMEADMKLASQAMLHNKQLDSLRQEMTQQAELLKDASNKRDQYRHMAKHNQDAFEKLAAKHNELQNKADQLRAENEKQLVEHQNLLQEKENKLEELRKENAALLEEKAQHMAAEEQLSNLEGIKAGPRLLRNAYPFCILEFFHWRRKAQRTTSASMRPCSAWSTRGGKWRKQRRKGESKRRRQGRSLKSWAPVITFPLVRRKGLQKQPPKPRAQESILFSQFLMHEPVEATEEKKQKPTASRSPTVTSPARPPVLPQSKEVVP